MTLSGASGRHAISLELARLISVEPRRNLAAQRLARVLTRVLVAINVIVYLCEHFVWGLDRRRSPRTARCRADVLNGEWWRIFTSAFLHGSDMHIIFNMIALLQVGTFVEMIYGTPRMAIMYFLAAIGGGLAVTYLHRTS